MINFKDISLTLKQKKLFNGFDLKIGKGEKILFNSGSGTGKTSLFKMLLGFQLPDSGEIRIGNDLLTSASLKEIRSKFAYLSQDIDLPGYNFNKILDEVYSYELNSHLTRNNDQILELFDKFNLTKEFLHKEITEISGGERQRLGLIVCILLQRSVWLLDEPTSALDANMRELIVDIALNSDKTVLVISHDKQWLNSDELRIVRWENGS